MPLFTAIGASLAGSLGLGALGQSLISTALSIGALYAVNKLFAPDVDIPRPDTRRPGPALAVDNARWVVGRARTGGVRTFFQEVDREFWMVQTISEGSCEGIERIWVNGERVAFTRNGTHLDCGKAIPNAPLDPDEEPTDYTDRLEIYEYFSAGGNQGAEIREACSDFTEEHLGHGLSWVAIRCIQPEYGDDTENRFWFRIPDVEFLVKGIHITWPGVTTPTWTENAAALRFWFETVRKGIPESVVDVTSFNAAYNTCEATVNFTLPAEYAGFTGSFKRYTINGVVSSAHGAEDIASEMDQAWQGNIAEAGGVLHFNAGADRTVRYNLTEEDTVSMGDIQTGPSLQDRINAVTMTVEQSLDHDYLQYDLPEVRDPDAFTRDRNQYLPLDTGQRLFIDGPVRAAWMAYIALRDARGSMRIPLTVRPGTEAAPFAYMGILPGEWVTYSNSEIGLNNKLFMVVSRSIHEDFSVTLLLEEQFTGNFAENLILPPLRPRDINIGNQRIVPEVDNLTLDEIAEVQGDGTTLVLLYAMWDSNAFQTEIQMRVKGETDTRNATTKFQRYGFPGVLVGTTYEVRARHVNRFEVTGTWTDWEERLIGGDLTPPADPVNFTLETEAGGWLAKWDPPTEEDYLHTQIWENTTNDFASARKVAENDSTEHIQLGYRTQRTVYVWARHVDRSKNLSGTATDSIQTGVHPVDYEDPAGTYTNSGRNIICYWEGNRQLTSNPTQLSLMNRLVGKTLQVIIEADDGTQTSATFSPVSEIGTNSASPSELGFAWKTVGASMFMYTNSAKSALFVSKASGADFAVRAVLGQRSPLETDTPIRDVPRAPPTKFNTHTCGENGSVSLVDGLINVSFGAVNDIFGDAFGGGLLTGLTSVVLGGPDADPARQGEVGLNFGDSFRPDVASTICVDLIINGKRVPILGEGDGGLTDLSSIGSYLIDNAGSLLLSALTGADADTQICVDVKGEIPQDAHAPQLTLTDLTTIEETSTAILEATTDGGVFDEIEYSWEIVSGGGTLEAVDDENIGT